MKENDGLLDPEMPTQQLRLHMGELTSNELRVARAAIAWASTRSRPVDAALKSPPEIEGEYTLEGNSAAFVYVCQDGKKIATVYGSGEEKLERGYTIINALNAALKSPPEPFQPAGKGKCEGCGTDGNTLWNKHGYKYCFTCRPSVDAALPHCPDGFALIKLGRFKPTPFSPVTYVTKTHPDTIRVDCVGEKNSYSFALPIAAAEG